MKACFEGEVGRVLTQIKIDDRRDNLPVPNKRSDR